MNDAPPSALEALRPLTPCDDAELLRFLNFTSALTQWWWQRSRFLAENNPETNNATAYWLYHQTIDILQKISIYLPVPIRGHHYQLDRAFVELFPPVLPMPDGMQLEWMQLLRILKHLRKTTAAAGKSLTR